MLDSIRLTDPLECAAFASPAVYCTVLFAAFLAKRKGFAGPRSTVFHNRNMVAQSVVLVGLTAIEYWTTAYREALPLTSFLEVSRSSASYHREQVHDRFILLVFLASKVFEWYDTVLLILNGKPTIVLHLWHHATIGIAFYTGWHTECVFWIGGLNSFIHVLMYAYYSGSPWVKRVARYLTQLQIVQLVGGAALGLFGMAKAVEDGDPRRWTFACINAAICVSYALLFLDFYRKKYKRTVKRSGGNEPRRGTGDATDRPRRVIIGDRKYDVTHFKHPGGRVIEFMTDGQDATEAFREFHHRSTRANAVLRSLPSVEVPRPGEDRAMLDDFARFRDQLLSEGFFKPDIPMVLYRLAEWLALFLVAAWLSGVSKLGAVCVYGMFCARSGWIQHEGGHGSLTGVLWADKAIQDIVGGFGLRGCGGKWNEMHNKHHATPQKCKRDVDMDTAPLVAFNRWAAAESGRHGTVSRWFLRFQAYTFLPLTAGILVPLFWMLYLHPRKALRERNARQVVAMAAGHLIPPTLFCTWGGLYIPDAVGIYLFGTWLGYMYIFGHFSLSHTFTDVVESDRDISWIRYATEHSVDISVRNPAVDWVMGYLNYQVVHHLFPSMPQHRGPEVSSRWEAFCKKHDLKYIQLGYYDAWRRMLSNLHGVGNPIR